MSLKLQPSNLQCRCMYMYTKRPGFPVALLKQKPNNYNYPLRMHVYMYNVQYASKKTFHTVAVNRRLNSSAVPCFWR